MSISKNGHTLIMGNDHQPILDDCPMSLANWVIEECSKLERFSVEIKNTKPKSHKQLGDFFGNMMKVIIEELANKGEDCSLIYNFPDPTKSTGVKITADMLRQFFYAISPIFKEDGVTRKTMRDYTTTEMRDFAENIRNFSAGQWGIDVPLPDPEWFLKKDGKNE